MESDYLIELPCGKKWITKREIHFYSGSRYLTVQRLGLAPLRELPDDVFGLPKEGPIDLNRIFTVEVGFRTDKCTVVPDFDMGLPACVPHDRLYVWIKNMQVPYVVKVWLRRLADWTLYRLMSLESKKPWRKKWAAVCLIGVRLFGWIPMNFGEKS